MKDPVDFNGAAPDNVENQVILQRQHPVAEPFEFLVPGHPSNQGMGFQISNPFDNGIHECQRSGR